MKVSLIDPKSLKPYAKNAKPHTDTQIKELAAMIKRDGFDQPIVVTSDLTIIKGHGRTQASLLLELDEVPVIVREDLSKEEADLSRIVDNEAVDTEWDAAALSMELKGIGEFDGELADTLLDDMELAMLNSISTAQGQAVQEVNLSDVETDHECGNCGYKW